MNRDTFGEPAPVANDRPELWPELIARLSAQSGFGQHTDLMQTLFAVSVGLVMAKDFGKRWGIDAFSKEELSAAKETVLKIAAERHEFGKQKYGVGLQPFNGRNFLNDAIEESLDLMVYIFGNAVEKGTIDDLG